MNKKINWSRILIIVGSIAVVVGAIDPLEGSIVILVGSGLVTLGAFLAREQRSFFHYWLAVFILVLIGVGALWILSALGGIGGSTGLSMWWGLTLLPYIVGGIMGIVNIFIRIFRFFKARK